MFKFWDTVIRPIFDLTKPASIVEIGASEGLHTRRVLEYCRENGATLDVIDVFTLPDLKGWEQEYGSHLRVHIAKSIDALPHLHHYDAVLIDGDHNWYSVYHELLLIEKEAQRRGKFPIVLLHDTAWPFDRRDGYQNPDDIPVEFRQPYERGFPLRDSVLLQTKEQGAPYRAWFATRQGGARNGVLTAIEDFLEQTEVELRLVTIPAYFGCSIITPLSLGRDVPGLTEFLDTIETSPLLSILGALEIDRLEALGHLARNTVDAAKLSYQLNRSRRTAETIVRHARGADQSVVIDQLREREKTLHRMERTRSWLWTAPLRRWEHRLKTSRLAGCRWLQRSLRGQKRQGFRSGLQTPMSVIILSHRQPKMLHEAIRSVLGQSMKPSEIIIVDSGSDDETLVITAQYQHRGVLYMHGHFSDDAMAWNAGARCATTPFILCMNAGSRLPPKYMEECLHALEKETSACIAYGDLLTVGGQVAFRETTLDTAPCCALLRRSVFDACGGFRASDSYPHWDLFQRMLQGGNRTAVHIAGHTIQEVS